MALGILIFYLPKGGLYSNQNDLRELLSCIEAMRLDNYHWSPCFVTDLRDCPEAVCGGKYPLTRQAHACLRRTPHAVIVL